MKLAPRDSARLLDLRRRAEDPGRWNFAPGATIEALGKERFAEVLAAVRAGESGSMEIRLTAEDVAKVRSAPGRAEDVHLSHGVFVMYEVYGVPLGGVTVLKRKASLSRSSRGRLPEKYVRQVVAKLGFSLEAHASVNPSSGVWHVADRFEAPDSDDVGAAVVVDGT